MECYGGRLTRISASAGVLRSHMVGLVGNVRATPNILDHRRDGLQCYSTYMQAISIWVILPLHLGDGENQVHILINIMLFCIEAQCAAWV